MEGEHCLCGGFAVIVHKETVHIKLLEPVNKFSKPATCKITHTLLLHFYAVTAKYLQRKRNSPSVMHPKDKILKRGGRSVR